MPTRTPNTSRLLPFVITLTFLCTSGEAQNWVHAFSPVRVLYVAPGASGSGTESNPMSFAAAIESANPGDLYWMLPGTYVGKFRLSRSGVAGKPIVFRGVPGERVVIDGAIEIAGAHNWIWGLEITDPTERAPQDSGVRVVAAGVHVLNNVVHHQTNKNGIGAWSSGPGQVIYGNVVYDNGQGPNHPHNIYTQNDFAKFGRKYVVENLLLSADDVCGDCFNFHAYTEGGLISGFHLQGNVVARGRLLIGGYNEPETHEVVVGNYFYDADARFGYRRPTHVEFRSNYLGRSTLDTQWFWGAGETQYTYPGPNTFTGNTILLPPGPHVRFRTSAYLSSGRCEGCPRIRSVDTFDNNTYSTPFSATFFANNNNIGTVDLATWRSATASAGKAFDGSSTVVAAPSGTNVVLLPNDYEPGRAHLAIFNWGKRDSVTVDLSTVVSQGAAYSVYPAKDLYGTPAAGGAYSGPVQIPLSGAEFRAFVVVSDVTGAPQPQILSPAPGSTLAGSSATFKWTANGGSVDQWALSVGSARGGSDVFDSGSLGTATSRTVSGIPTDGRNLFVRLSYDDGSGWQSVDAQYDAATLAVGPAITTPSPGSILGGASATFRWSLSGGAVHEWRLTLGSTAGGTDLFNGSSGTSTSASVSGLPTDGSAVHARLRYRDDKGWQFVDHGYTAATVAGTPEIVSPAPGTTLGGASATFAWKSHGAPVLEWWLYAGSVVGGRNYFDSGSLGASKSVNVTGLPTNGTRIFVRLWYRTSNGWSSIDYEYTAFTSGIPSEPSLVEPVPGSVLSGSTPLFRWTDNGVAASSWWLYIGATPGGREYFDSGPLDTLSVNARGLPVNGSTVHVRLWYLLNGDWKTVDAEYKAAGSASASPQVTSPKPGSTLAASEASFAWVSNGAAVTEWWLYVGSFAGGMNYFDSGSLGTKTSVTATALPTDESTIHVRLWYRIGGVWSFADYTYTAGALAGGPTMVAPASGSMLPGSTASFQWTANGTAAASWWLYAGSTVGARNYHDSGPLGTQLTTTVAGLPTDGSDVHVRLWYLSGSVWKTKDYQYKAVSQ